MRFHRSLLLLASVLSIAGSTGAGAADPAPAVPDPENIWAMASVSWSDFSLASRPLDPVSEEAFCVHAQDSEGNDLLSCHLWMAVIHVETVVPGELQVYGQQAAAPGVESHLGLYYDASAVAFDGFIGQIVYRTAPDEGGGYPAYINAGVVLATVQV